MLASLLSVLALTSAVSVAAAPSALPAHPFLNIVARADAASELPGGATIPAACASTCSSTLTIYGYCLDADTKCLDICTDDGFDQFYSCVNCAFQYESFTASQYVQLQATASTLSQTCSAAGKTVNSTSSFTPYAEASSVWAQPAWSSSAAAAAATGGAAAAAVSASAAAASSSAAGTSAGSRTMAVSAGLVGAVAFVGAVLA